MLLAGPFLEGLAGLLEAFRVVFTVAAALGGRPRRGLACAPSDALGGRPGRPGVTMGCSSDLAAFRSIARISV